MPQTCGTPIIVFIDLQALFTSSTGTTTSVSRANVTPRVVVFVVGFIGDFARGSARSVTVTNTTNGIIWKHGVKLSIATRAKFTERTNDIDEFDWKAR